MPRACTCSHLRRSRNTCAGLSLRKAPETMGAGSSSTGTARARRCVPCKPEAAATQVCFNITHCKQVYRGFDQVGDLKLAGAAFAARRCTAVLR